MNSTAKKAAFTVISLPIIYKTHWAYNWQMERKQWKETLIKERSQKLEAPHTAVKLNEIVYPNVAEE